MAATLPLWLLCQGCMPLWLISMSSYGIYRHTMTGSSVAMSFAVQGIGLKPEDNCLLCSCSKAHIMMSQLPHSY